MNLFLCVSLLVESYIRTYDFVILQVEILFYDLS